MADVCYTASKVVIRVGLVKPVIFTLLRIRNVGILDSGLIRAVS